MLKLIFFIIINIIFLNTSFADSKESSCTWDNKNEISCLKINGHISNASKYSQSGINKIIINKKQIEEIGAVDLIDVLKTIPDINLVLLLFLTVSLLGSKFIFLTPVTFL